MTLFDVLYVAIVLAFFVVASLLVVACERITGRDDVTEP